MNWPGKREPELCPDGDVHDATVGELDAKCNKRNPVSSLKPRPEGDRDE